MHNPIYRVAYGGIICSIGRVFLLHTGAYCVAYGRLICYVPIYYLSYTNAFSSRRVRVFEKYAKEIQNKVILEKLGLG